MASVSTGTVKRITSFSPTKYPVDSNARQKIHGIHNCNIKWQLSRAKPQIKGTQNIKWVFQNGVQQESYQIVTFLQPHTGHNPIF